MLRHSLDTLEGEQEFIDFYRALLSQEVPPLSFFVGSCTLFFVFVRVNACLQARGPFYHLNTKYNISFYGEVGVNLSAVSNQPHLSCLLATMFFTLLVIHLFLSAVRFSLYIWAS